MKTLLMLVAVILALGAADSGRRPQAQKETKSEFRIEGRVINAAGEAVAGANVFVDADNGAGLVLTADSDEEGGFSIELRELGNYTVYGSKEEDGYPLTVSGFHKQVPLDQIPKLRITERKNVENVVVQLGERAAKIEGTVKDVLTDRSIQTATITLRRADNPDLLYQTSTQAATPGKFKIVVPTDPFTITVTSHGYQAWTYGDDGTPVRTRGPLKLNRGEVRKFQVGLRLVN